MNWCLNAVPPLALRCWGDECVLYDVASGDTHLIQRFAAALLQRLEQSPADAATLARYLAADDDAVVLAALTTQIDDVLDDLASVELVHRSAA